MLISGSRSAAAPLVLGMTSGCLTAGHGGPGAAEEGAGTHHHLVGGLDEPPVIKTIHTYLLQDEPHQSVIQPHTYARGRLCSKTACVCTNASM